MSGGVPLHQLSDAERSIIAKNTVENEHTITDFKLTPTSGYGNLGEYFHVELTIIEKNGKPEKHRFFMKTMPSDPWQRDFLVKDGMFQKEVNFYNGLSVCFRKFLSTDVCPKCFLSVPGKIVMADATSQGYRLWKGITQQPLDYQHTKVGLMALARLHAGSIIYEEKTGKKVGDDFPDAAREVHYTEGNMGLDFLRSGGEAIAALVPHLETAIGRDPEAVALLQENVVAWILKLEYYLKAKFPHRQVICHGDCWPANFLYRYNDDDQTQNPLSAILVDFQLTRLRSPAVDVNMFMYLSVPADDLKKWRASLLDAYHEVLTQEMRHCELDADSIYPKEEFQQEYIYYQIVGLIFTLLYFPFCLIPLEVKLEEASKPEKAKDFYFQDRSQQLIKWYKEYPLLRKYLNEATEELYQNFVKTKRGLTTFTS